MAGFFGESDREEWKLAHRTITNRTISDRIKAILLFDRSMSAAEICEILLIDEATGRRYLKIFEDEGIDGVMACKYIGSQGKLTRQQQEKLTCHLEKTLYAKVEDVSRYVEKRFGASDTVSGMTKLLHHLNFVYKKTKHTQGKAVNAQSTIRLSRKLEKEHPGNGRIYLIVDNARYYRSRLVREFLEIFRAQRVFFHHAHPISI